MRPAVLAAAFAAFVTGTNAASAAAPDYVITRSVPIGVPDRWDYVTFAPQSGRLYVAHGSETTILDGRDGHTIGRLAPLDGAHGQVVRPALGRAYADSGKAGDVSVFALGTARLLATLPAQPDADAMVDDPASGRIFVMDGDSGTITAIDAAADRVAGTIDLHAGALEFAAADGRGHLFVNLAAARGVAEIDTRTLRETGRFALPDCTSPHGMAYDRATRRIFTSCVDGWLDVLDARSGREVARLPIGRGSDAVVLDARRRRVFSSNGDGTLSVIPIGDQAHFGPVTTIRTEPGARTLALDPASGRLFSVTADIAGQDPPHVPGSAPRWRFKPGTVRVLFLDPR